MVLSSLSSGFAYKTMVEACYLKQKSMTAHTCTHTQNLEVQIYCLASLTLLRVQKLEALVLYLLLECSHYWHSIPK